MPERSSLPHDVAAEVRAHLARQRLSGRQAAIRLGWTQPYMSRRLTGEIPFDVADLEAIADLLGIPATAFFQRPRHTGPRVIRRDKVEPFKMPRSWTLGNFRPLGYLLAA